MTKHPSPCCVVKVGGGRGFIIEHVWSERLSPELAKRFGRRVFHHKKRLVVTAAHCLPKLPPAHAAAYTQERTYAALLGRLDGEKNDVWAECLFADPVADIAVLGCPDDQELAEQADRYHALTDEAPALSIGMARSGRGWVLSLASRWVRTTLEVFSGLGGPSLSIDPTEAGQSGSPILNEAGQAVGIVAIGSETVSASGERKKERAGPQPVLAYNLPGWLLLRAR